MSKKSLKGLVKTHHFKQRQKERKVSDRDVLRALYEGELIENDYGRNFVLGDIKVTVDYALEVLITVHPKDPPTRAMKLLSSDEARKIKDFIAQFQKPAEEPDEFLKFVTDNKVKKLF
jgi:hypothetical protein